MDTEQARKIWGPDMPQDVLEDWIRIVNKRRKAFDEPRAPKGATVEIDPNTGKAIPTNKY